ncbi:bestrophin-1-like isoform X1 [Tigriopus californicus]|uniref:bestrophin-1-like isoform X1 n=1 Tax=Tigriopus californicus TaxID=6832 RepID=UPI0027D9E2DA|nr:bestrophin-1-like isoform X1 [Tigriopus californicus]XP_059095975.1 bestrophin-1-like isoform X1 [Tigriopus californicus]XP_059095976.1 bestrophin-1-like isoform X1 [Tigriopus californicus]XP_059095977.1 bestrophin-1-like isoform X1 [Tigriopus californicus]XP_059095978.1 bestrophin-1-like isoform X1 [Tigriopus californicus]XP_059095979.1 bestrophin-1-like isoform X1 [Tigriopus californicus]
MPDPKVQQYEQSLFKDYSHSSDCNYFKQHLLRILTVRHLVKLIYVELIVYLILFYTINGAYRFLFDDDQRREFDKVVEYFSANINYFGRDLTFLLGFYVSMVAKRWWDQYRLLPWPDDIAMGLTAYVVPNNVESEKLRKTIIRYALLSYVLCIRRFSANLKRHLPTVEKIVELGILRMDEVSFLNINDFSGSGECLLVSNWWLPLAWSANMVKFGSTSNQIPADQKELMKAILNFRKGLESVESHVHVAIPLVYKVVVNTAIYSYFALTLISDQILERQDDKFDPYVPILTLFKLVTLIAWLKVAQAIEKPFDEDDSDFEMHALVKRHIRTTSIILNEFDKVPPLKNVTFDHTEIKSSPPSVESFEMYDSNAESPESSISMGSMSKEESKNQDQVPYHHKPKDSVVIDDLNPNGPWRITTAKMNQILPDNSLRPAQKSQDELDLKSAGSSSNNISIAS